MSENGAFKMNAYGLTSPDDWWETTLAKVCSGDEGLIQTGPFGSQLHASDYEDVGTPVVMPKQLGDNSISIDGIARVSNDHVERLARHQVREGDIVFSRRGDVTRRAYITRNESGWLCGTGCMLIRPDHQEVLNEYLAFFFTLDEFKSYITLNAVGATMPNLNTTILERIPLFLPRREVQEKIVAVVSAYDDLIENNTRRIALLEEMGQAIYREWFVHFRYPGHEAVKLVDSRFCQIPEGWEILKLADCCKLVMGQSPKSEFYNEAGEGLPFHQGVTNFGPRYPTHKTFCTVKNRLANRGDILFSVRAPVGRINIANTEIIIGRGVSSIRRNDDAQVFLFHQLRDKFKEEDTMGGGTIFKSVTKNDLSTLPLVNPPADLLYAFESLVGASFTLYDNLTRRNEYLRTTRDLLLPKLISGKLDVADLDIDTGGLVEQLAEANVERATAVSAVTVAHTLTGVGTAETAGAHQESEAATVTPPPEQNHQPVPVDELEAERVMAEFRQEARKLGTTSRAELIKAVSVELGYQRLGANIEEALKGHLRAAIRRGIIGTAGDEVWLETPTMADYDRDVLIDTFRSVMRKNQEYERDEVMRSLANHLGFRRLRETVREPIKSAINGAIRRGVLGYEGNLIWRED